jgi:hypothetical protein
MWPSKFQSLMNSNKTKFSPMSEDSLKDKKGVQGEASPPPLFFSLFLSPQGCLFDTYITPFIFCNSTILFRTILFQETALTRQRRNKCVNKVRCVLIAQHKNLTWCQKYKFEPGSVKSLAQKAC